MIQIYPLHNILMLIALTIPPDKSRAYYFARNTI